MTNLFTSKCTSFFSRLTHSGDVKSITMIFLFVFNQLEKIENVRQNLLLAVRNMSLSSARPSISTSSNILSTINRHLPPPDNHLFAPDGLPLGVTYSKTIIESRKMDMTSSYVCYEGETNSNSSCTIM